MPPKGSSDRYFTVGETVHLRSRVSLPGTRTPTDPASVALTTLRREGVDVLTGPMAFIRNAEGDFSLSLPTLDLTPGTYDLVVTHSDGPEKVTLVTDRFVLAPAP